MSAPLCIACRGELGPGHVVSECLAELDALAVEAPQTYDEAVRAGIRPGTILKATRD